ncbi:MULTISPECIES: tripartite tricarboxylate transporter permease [unclassified Desulfovibrio]|uniref:tripartite tricarboxylate transporter permease n=1 Tax=unclassified Desulfovibrio TaxID=2593640 RepID=UPI0013ED1B62|nr:MULTISPECIES: tripartite tricarboxylate transporter permease [unclassified Desulfovibrio]
MGPEIMSALSMALSPASLLANAFGVALGITFGALPGLTATMGVALLMPLTFNMPPVEAFSSLLGMYCGAIYGGCITAILVGTPGTVAAAATMLEGPRLTARGLGKKALDMATLASFLGGVLSCIALMTIAPLLARAAMAFGPAEYFSVAFFGMAIVATLAASSVLKGAIATLLGLYIATIGGDPISGELRNTFEIPALFGGISLVPILVGLFAVGQILISLEEGFISKDKPIKKVDVSGKGLGLREFFSHWVTLIRSSIIGIVVGIVPATGSGTASYIAYSTAKQTSKHPEKFGTGILEGVAATESANNAVTGAALIPLLTLGVPGDMVTAVMLGAMMIQGLVPGPMLFKDAPDAVFGIFIALWVANCLMCAMGLVAVRPLSKVLQIPKGILMPSVMTLCVVGGYAVNNSMFDLYIVSIFGVLGYVMHKIDMPASPLLLSVILAPIAETNFRRALVISNNDYSVFVTSPICVCVLLASFLVVARAAWMEVNRRRREHGNGTEPGEQSPDGTA